MLVLSRKINEEIQIGAYTTVRVLEIQGSHVRLGIEAPRHINVVRGELGDPPMRELPRLPPGPGSL